MVPELHYIRHEPSRVVTLERMLPQSVDNALRAKGLPVLELLLVPKKEGKRHSDFTQRNYFSFYCKHCRNHTGSLHSCPIGY